MPYYQVLAEQLNLPTVTEQQTLFTEGQVYHFDIRYMQWHGIPIYFVDSTEYFMREGLYANAFEAYEDNGERFSFFSGAVLQTLKAIDKKPDVIHCHDWHAAMLPFLLHINQGILTARKRYSHPQCRFPRRSRKLSVSSPSSKHSGASARRLHQYAAKRD